MDSKKRIFIKGTSGAAYVKEGFSWPAFFFGSLWAAVKGMWYPHFVLMLLVDAVFWFGTGYAEARNMGGVALFLLCATLVYAVLRGRFGNRWRMASLRSRGYAESRVA